MHQKIKIKSFRVQNTLGYTFGGDISISNGLSGKTVLNGNTAFSETINYKTEDQNNIKSQHKL